MNKDNKLIVKLACLFYICSILGFFYELILNYFENKKIFSHGILFGPWLPIYGTGALLIMLLYKCHDNPYIIFFASFFLTAFLEGTCGFILLKFFKKRLWDYTGYFLNIKGFVCFLSAFCFGLGGLLITYVIYPLIDKIVSKINIKEIENILSFITIIFLGDIIATILK